MLGFDGHVEAADGSPQPLASKEFARYPKHMPRYWFTQHWPRPVNPKHDVLPWFIFLQHRYQYLGKPIRAGDGVAFYETLQGQPYLDETTGQLVKLVPGHGAVVRVAEASGRLQKGTVNVRQYRDGNSLNWAWEVPCHRDRPGTPVTLRTLRDIRNRKSFRLRGGLIEITADQFTEIKTRLLQ